MSLALVCLMMLMAVGHVVVISGTDGSKVVKEEERNLMARSLG